MPSRQGNRRAQDVLSEKGLAVPQFLIIAKDYTDSEALSRRMAARDAHLALCDQAAAKGEQRMGVAMLGEDGNMCGSAMVVDFPSEDAVQAWLAKEPYMTGKVWEHVEIIPCKIGPSFT